MLDTFFQIYNTEILTSLRKKKNSYWYFDEHTKL